MAAVQQFAPKFVGTLPLANMLRDGRRLVFDAALATRILEDAEYPRQRKVDDRHVRRLAGRMRRGLWMPGRQIAFGRVAGRFYLLDGQHRLWAVLESGIPVEFSILVIDEDTFEALRPHYWNFNRAERARSDAQVLNAYGFSDQFDCPREIEKAAFRAIPAIVGGFDLSNLALKPFVDDDQRFDALRDWGPTLNAIGTWLAPAATRLKTRLLTVGAFGVVMLTARHQKSQAESFWSAVAVGAGLEQTDPRWVLREWLLQTDRGRGGSYGTAARYAADAWNLKFTGKRRKRLEPVNPFKIDGTPIGHRGR